MGQKTRRYPLRLRVQVHLKHRLLRKQPVRVSNSWSKRATRGAGGGGIVWVPPREVPTSLTWSGEMTPLCEAVICFAGLLFYWYYADYCAYAVLS